MSTFGPLVVVPRVAPPPQPSAARVALRRNALNILLLVFMRSFYTVTAMQTAINAAGLPLRLGVRATA